MTITIILSMLSVAFAGLFGYATYSNRRQKDDKTVGAEKGTMMSEIGYIKAGVDDIKRENRETAVKIGGLTERITRCEESCKQAHHRIDEIKGGE